MVKAIKDRVNELKKEERWKEKAKKRYMNPQDGNENNDENENDKMSMSSNNDEKRSVASEHTQ